MAPKAIASKGTTQVCYLQNAHCVRSDNRFLLLFPRPHGYDHGICCFVDLCSQLVYCINSLLLSGDVETNPGPPKKDSKKTKQDNVVSVTEDSRAANSGESDNDGRDIERQPTVSDMFAELLAGQKKMAQDIAQIKLFQQSVNSRFDALEARVAALESPSATPSVPCTSCDNLLIELKSLSGVVDRLVARNDDMENRLRRNNLILYGLTESADETSESLLSNVSKIFSDKLIIDCPRIERCHRIGRKHDDRSRPVIMKLLDFREKMEVLKNSFKLKGSDIRISEDFSVHVRSVRKKIWDATASFRDSGSSVRLRYDHVFINNERYNWDVKTNTLVKCSDYSAQSTTTAPSTGGR
ncbi:uncharacterized protein LOC120848305 [Ixodes scapularis]|uniref:uncharacterized protein LOC120848305 n=1 Tax=Ixodes scapularis TaxID=6945 RepID=UPI001A9E9F38|nr:uncharacterized protein LOC120848305 [Ixodes scapularis]